MTRSPSPDRANPELADVFTNMMPLMASDIDNLLNMHMIWKLFCMWPVTLRM